MSGGSGQINSQFAPVAGETASIMQGKLEEPDHSSCNWYFSREEIEKHSPSRKDGIDMKKEIYFRKSYCTYLQDLGMRLKVPQVTIATAIVFCHRFFLRQSHAKNDRHLVATVCMFLAGKVEETPRPLRDVILISYEIRNKKDPTAVQRVRQKDVYEEQKDLVLTGERLVLATLGFDLNIHHPYKPLVTAIKKYKVAQHALAQVAWNFVNDGLRTSLCLQFKPHHIAAGAIFLAAKFLKVKLPSDEDKAWWQEFEVTPRQLEEVSNQMLELYEQNKGGTGSRTSDLNGSVGTSVHEKLGVVTSAHANVATSAEKGPTSPGKTTCATQADRSFHQGPLHPSDGDVAATSSYKHDTSNPTRTATTTVVSHASDLTSDFQQKVSEINSDFSRAEETTGTTQNKTDNAVAACTSDELEDSKIPVKVESVEKQIEAESQVAGDDGICGDPRAGRHGSPDLVVDARANSMDIEPNNLRPLAVEPYSDSNLEPNVPEEIVKPEPQVGQEKKHYAGLDEVNKDRVKAAIEKRRRSRGEGAETLSLASKLDLNDEDELLERELESGVEAALKAERVKHGQNERRDGPYCGRDIEVVEMEKLSQVKLQLDTSEGPPAEVDELKQEGIDKEDVPRVLEAAAEADTMSQSRKDNKIADTQRLSRDPFDAKMERSCEPDGSRKRPKDEILLASERKWPRILDRTDVSGDSDRARPKERTEVGEVHNSHEQVHSPRSESRSLPMSTPRKVYQSFKTTGPCESWPTWTTGQNAGE